jgi:hypothetical protein
MGTKPAGSKSRKVNKQAAKKTGAKKPAAAKKVSGKSKQKPLKEELLDQIWAMALTLDEESLKKLLQDAAILAHNERVIKDFTARKGQAGPQIKAVTAAVEEGTDGTYFIIILNNYRNFLSLDEMRDLVKRCHAAANKRDATLRLFAWIERDRSDIKKNSKIADEDDPCLAALWEKVINTYDLKG